MALGGDKGRRELTSWKEIAEFLGVSVRTAQRQETMGLPVRRLGGGKGSAVVAYTDELATWKEKSAEVPRFWQNVHSLRKALLVSTAVVAVLALLYGRTLFVFVYRAGSPRRCCRTSRIKG